jgi:hypothetical protein
VRRGEKAITLCRPVTVKRSTTADDGTEGTTAATFFVYRPQWFVLAQTEGKPVTEPATPPWNKDRALAALDIQEITFDLLDGNCLGFARQRSIAVNPVNPLPHKTRFHELAHVVLGHTSEGTMNDGELTPRNLREVEAESVALLCLAALNLPGVEFSRGYIQAWWGERNPIPEKSAQRILKAADQILKAGTEQSSDDTGGGVMPPVTGQRAAIYARVSSSDQTCENHLPELRRYCEAPSSEQVRQTTDRRPRSGTRLAAVFANDLNDKDQPSRRRRRVVPVVFISANARIHPARRRVHRGRLPKSLATQAFGINPQGDIVGAYRDTASVFHGFVLQGGAFTSIDVPGAALTQAVDISPTGDIVGVYQTAEETTTGVFHMFVLSKETFTTVDYPAAVSTGGLNISVGIAPRGSIVGQYRDGLGGHTDFMSMPMDSQRSTSPGIRRRFYGADAERCGRRTD